MSNQGIKVRIFNNEYHLQGDDAEQVERIANYVDNLMQKINFESPGQRPETIAVVSALNIAENYFKEKESSGRNEKICADILNECSSKLDELSKLIDSNL
ncbi:cell division protein ZapA [Ignavibacteria bacterium CHB1]|jgi:Cell division protein ZapA.|nr:MAG: cell division protein ZapA [Chlorobiota bacterium]KXK03462.1 MAG: Cell division protein ZapA [Chlorobi bacterium OLB4]MBV6398975.1 Cell division protein ZapA [Ignavibacteria bacterium]MCC6886187.1 cell division protein ZapA [Ignavibacteriales bacterium]MCE7953883.1 cell division protein ZapA [Chlorobi bacterium CHB7]MDL1887802.1 cell division protein ZapA [Ignavibacteria bacterium CHB1]OQY77107.1 MAG: hypothetical protein B6D43_08330 [Ignavibacteriales bacterium UTCHB1]RIK47776.1 MAG